MITHKHNDYTQTHMITVATLHTCISVSIILLILAQKVRSMAEMYACVELIYTIRVFPCKESAGKLTVSLFPSQPLTELAAPVV